MKKKICKECKKPIKECVMKISLKEMLKKMKGNGWMEVLSESKKHKAFLKDLERIK